MNEIGSQHNPEGLRYGDKVLLGYVPAYKKDIPQYLNGMWQQVNHFTKRGIPSFKWGVKLRKIRPENIVAVLPKDATLEEQEEALRRGKLYK